MTKEKYRMKVNIPHRAEHTKQGPGPTVCKYNKLINLFNIRGDVVGLTEMI